jgi:pimeloyl-ACP methyl ester carboxylesterase
MVPPSVRYVTTPDGYSIAYAVSGAGLPLIFLPLTFSHARLYWEGNTILSAWLKGLSDRFQLVQYDGRGQGLSTRGLRPGHGPADELADLSAVVDQMRLERLILMARGPLGHAAVRYAAANPERVQALLLFSMPATGERWPFAFASRLAKENWDLFLQSFTAFDGRRRTLWRPSSSLNKQ